MTEAQALLRACELAERGRFAAAPNPCVGAVITDASGSLLAEGYHKAYGEPHAEVEAIARARDKGVDLTDATLYVTLEPCNHQGKTPPCTEAILAAGIPRVVVGHPDPNPLATGGLEYLRSQGVEARLTVDPIARQTCADSLADFLAWTMEKRPHVTLKLAATLDGRIATRTGHSQWITSPEARADVHRLRARMDAVLVGGSTFHQDNPSLTVRPPEGDPAPERQPLAVVATTRLPAPEDEMALIAQRSTETVFLTSAELAASRRAERLAELGVRVLAQETLRDGLQTLFAEASVLTLLCEGGGRVGLWLLENGLVDLFHLYLAPRVLGDNEASPLFTGRAPQSMDETLNLRLLRATQIGPDIRLTYRPDADGLGSTR